MEKLSNYYSDYNYNKDKIYYYRKENCTIEDYCHGNTVCVGPITRNCISGYCKSYTGFKSNIDSLNLMSSIVMSQGLDPYNIGYKHILKLSGLPRRRRTIHDQL